MSERDVLIDRIAGARRRRPRLRRCLRPSSRLSGRGAPSDPVGLRPQDRARKRRRAKVSPGSSGCAMRSCRRSSSVGADRPAHVPLRLESEVAAVAWRLVDESGASSEGRAEPVAGARRTGALATAALAPGYHRLAVDAGERKRRGDAHRRAGAMLGAARRRRRGARAGASRRSSTPVARTRTSASAPMRMPARRPRTAAALGASFSASARSTPSFGADRGKISPYSPSSRLFLETLHIDPAPWSRVSRAARRSASSTSPRTRIAALREAAARRPRRRLGGPAACPRCAVGDVQGSRRSGLRRLPPRARGRRSRTTPPSRRSPSISAPRGGLGRRMAGSATAPPPRPRGRALPRRPPGAGRLPCLAAMARRQPARGGLPARARRRHDARPLPRPRRRRRPWRLRGLVASGALRRTASRSARRPTFSGRKARIGDCRRSTR